MSDETPPPIDAMKMTAEEWQAARRNVGRMGEKRRNDNEWRLFCERTAKRLDILEGKQ